MAKQVNYEVQVMQNGRWTIHARYLASENEEAITEAKQIAVSKIGDVHVLRDVYDPETGTSVESIVYSSKLNDRKKTAEGGNEVSSSGNWNAEDDYDNIAWEEEGEDGSMLDRLFDDGSRKRTKGKKTNKGLFKKKNRRPSQNTLPWFLIKLLLIVLLSFGAAMGVVSIAPPFLDGLNLFGIPMYGAARDNALIILFLAAFSITAFSLAFLLLRNVKIKRGKHRPRRRRHGPVPAGTGMGIKGNAAPPPIISPAAKPVRDPGFGQENPPGEPDTTAPQNTGDPGFGGGNDPAVPHGQEEPESETMMEGQEPSQPHTMMPHEEKQKAYMAEFTKSVLESVAQGKKSISSFDKFGASLFLAGACEAMAQKNRVGDQARDTIIADSLQTMGFKPDHADSFAKRYEEYLIQDPRYMQMFQAGRSTMNACFTDPSGLATDTAVAMDDWTRLKPAKEQSGPVAILFTDIVDFTALTGQLGDAEAQNILRIHNHTVREALAMYNGNEIKHTGDGLMSSFANASDSVDAAMQIQREAVAHTARHADKPLHLRIGINAGNPIAEDNDLYGAAVQMAARIVNEAGKEEIFVSELVQEICANKGYAFRDRGTYTMKGFKDASPLYEVVWRAS